MLFVFYAIKATNYAPIQNTPLTTEKMADSLVFTRQNG
jgi:hypothetical protein